MPGSDSFAGYDPKGMAARPGLSTGKRRLSRDANITLMTFSDDDLEPVVHHGYRYYSKKSEGETSIASILSGEIRSDRLPKMLSRVQGFVTSVGHQKVSIKVIDKQMASKRDIKELAAQLLKLSSSGNYHPRVALPYELIHGPAYMYLVSEFAEGVDVIKYMKSKSFDQNVARDIFLQLASAFEFTHDRGIVHRDLTPSSVKVNPCGSVKVQDFGISPKLSEMRPIQMHQRHKFSYDAPEVIKSRRYESLLADMFAVGSILYEMLHGQQAYVGTMSEVLKKMYARDLIFFDSIPPEAKSLIRKLVHPEPYKRPNPTQVINAPWTLGIRETGTPPPTEPELPRSPPAVSPMRTSERPLRDQYRSCAQATVNCGNERVVLRSRLPDKNIAFAMKMDYADVCTTLQPPRCASPKAPCSQPKAPLLTARAEQLVRTARKTPTPAPRTPGVRANTVCQLNVQGRPIPVPRKHKTITTKLSGSTSQNPRQDAEGADARPVRRKRRVIIRTFGRKVPPSETEASICIFDHGYSESGFSDDSMSTYCSEDEPTVAPQPKHDVQKQPCPIVTLTSMYLAPVSSDDDIAAGAADFNSVGEQDGLKYSKAPTHYAAASNKALAVSSSCEEVPVVHTEGADSQNAVQEDEDSLHNDKSSVYSTASMGALTASSSREDIAEVLTKDDTNNHAAQENEDSLHNDNHSMHSAASTEAITVSSSQEDIAEVLTKDDNNNDAIKEKEDDLVSGKHSVYSTASTGALTGSSSNEEIAEALPENDNNINAAQENEDSLHSDKHSVDSAASTESVTASSSDENIAEVLTEVDNNSDAAKENEDGSHSDKDSVCSTSSTETSTASSSSEEIAEVLTEVDDNKDAALKYEDDMHSDKYSVFSTASTEALTMSSSQENIPEVLMKEDNNNDAAEANEDGLHNDEHSMSSTASSSSLTASSSNEEIAEVLPPDDKNNDIDQKDEHSMHNDKHSVCSSASTEALTAISSSDDIAEELIGVDNRNNKDAVYDSNKDAVQNEDGFYSDQHSEHSTTSSKASTASCNEEIAEVLTEDDNKETALEDEDEDENDTSSVASSEASTVSSKNEEIVEHDAESNSDVHVDEGFLKKLTASLRILETLTDKELEVLYFSEIEEDFSPSEVSDSYKSDRDSSVPSDLGSMEPDMNKAFPCGRRRVARRHEATELDQCMLLPTLSDEDRVLEFLSEVPVNDTIPDARARRQRLAAPPPTPVRRAPSPDRQTVVTKPPLGIQRSRKQMPTNLKIMKTAIEHDSVPRKSRADLVQDIPEVTGQAITLQTLKNPVASVDKPQAKEVKRATSLLTTDSLNKSKTPLVIDTGLHDSVKDGKTDNALITSTSASSEVDEQLTKVARTTTRFSSCVPHPPPSPRPDSHFQRGYMKEGGGLRKTRGGQTNLLVSCPSPSGNLESGNSLMIEPATATVSDTTSSVVSAPATLQIHADTLQSCNSNGKKTPPVNDSEKSLSTNQKIACKGESPPFVRESEDAKSKTDAVKMQPTVSKKKRSVSVYDSVNGQQVPLKQKIADADKTPPTSSKGKRSSVTDLANNRCLSPKQNIHRGTVYADKACHTTSKGMKPPSVNDKSSIANRKRMPSANGKYLSPEQRKSAVVIDADKTPPTTPKGEKVSKRKIAPHTADKTKSSISNIKRISSGQRDSVTKMGPDKTRPTTSTGKRPSAMDDTLNGKISDLKIAPHTADKTKSSISDRKRISSGQRDSATKMGPDKVRSTTSNGKRPSSVNDTLNGKISDLKIAPHTADKTKSSISDRKRISSGQRDSATKMGPDKVRSTTSNGKRPSSVNDTLNGKISDLKVAPHTGDKTKSSISDRKRISSGQRDSATKMGPDKVRSTTSNGKRPSSVNDTLNGKISDLKIAPHTGDKTKSSISDRKRISSGQAAKMGPDKARPTTAEGKKSLSADNLVNGKDLPQNRESLREAISADVVKTEEEQMPRMIISPSPSGVPLNVPAATTVSDVTSSLVSSAVDGDKSRPTRSENGIDCESIKDTELSPNQKIDHEIAVTEEAWPATISAKIPVSISKGVNEKRLISDKKTDEHTVDHTSCKGKKNLSVSDLLPGKILSLKERLSSENIAAGKTLPINSDTKDLPSAEGTIAGKGLSLKQKSREQIDAASITKGKKLLLVPGSITGKGLTPRGKISHERSDAEKTAAPNTKGVKLPPLFNRGQGKRAAPPSNGGGSSSLLSLGKTAPLDAYLASLEPKRGLASSMNVSNVSQSALPAPRGTRNVQTGEREGGQPGGYSLLVDKFMAKKATQCRTNDRGCSSEPKALLPPVTLKRIEMTFRPPVVNRPLVKLAGPQQLADTAPPGRPPDKPASRFGRLRTPKQHR